MIKKILKHKYFLEILALTLALLVLALPVLAAEITPDNVIEYVNESREQNGLADLGVNKTLAKAAQEKLNDMIENNYFAHTSPEGLTPWHWFSKVGYDYQYAGENLAINFLTAEAQHQAWMQSPTHRKNILSINYQEIGVAVGAGKIDGQMAIISVQEFGTQIGAVVGTKNFSDVKNNNLIKDQGKIVPQVLSVKKVSENNSLSKLPVSQNTLNFTTVIFELILLVSLSLMPLAFLSVAYEKILVIKENMKKKKEQVNTEAYI